MKSVLLACVFLASCAPIAVPPREPPPVCLLQPGRYALDLTRSAIPEACTCPPEVISAFITGSPDVIFTVRQAQPCGVVEHSSGGEVGDCQFGSAARLNATASGIVGGESSIALSCGAHSCYCVFDTHPAAASSPVVGSFDALQASGL